MKLENDIKQSEFEDEYHRVVVNLIYSANWLRDEQVKLLKPYGLLPQHYNILRILKGKYPNPVSPGEIKAVMVDKANDLTRLLDKLVKKEMAVRNLCPHNHRKMDVSLTDKGVKLLEKMTLSLNTFQKEIKSRLSPKEANVLSDLLDKIRP